MDIIFKIKETLLKLLMNNKMIIMTRFDKIIILKSLKIWKIILKKNCFELIVKLI